MSHFEFEEEEFTTEFNGRTVLRILAQAKPHWQWLVGFLVCIAFVSVLESYFTFLSKRIVDEGILAGDREALMQIILMYGLTLLASAAGVFGFIYFAGILGERLRYDLA